MNQIKLSVKTILGFFMFHILPKKKIILILSSMRSGSTLLKALLGDAKDVSHINEFDFKRQLNKYATYFDIYSSAKEKIIVLKKPASYTDFYEYTTNHFQLPHKKIIIVRNPIDTIISLLNMNIKTTETVSKEVLINYWVVTYKKLKKEIDKNTFIVRYEDLIKTPIEITKTVYQFIGAKNKEGTSTYNKPISGKWEWGIDDGGEVIKKMKVVQHDKDYSKYESWIKKIKNSDEIMELVYLYNLKMPIHK